MDVSHLDYDHLRPPRTAFDLVHKGDYMLQIEGKRYIRRIFYDVFYTTHEGDKLEEFRNIIEKSNIKLPHDWTSEETMKFLYSGKFDIKKSLNNLKVHLEWRNNLPKDVPCDRTLEILKSGVVYISGRDKDYRPVIIIDVNKVKQNKIKKDDFIEALCFVLSVAKEFYFIPGKVENWIIIIETNGLGLLDFPFKVLKRIIESTSIHFACTVEKIYIMNPSRLLNSSWNLIQSCIDPVTREKIVMVKKPQYSQLFEYIPSNQLEVRYGGSLPDPEFYWPPKNTLNKSPYTQRKKIYEDTVMTREPVDFTELSKAVESNAWTTLDNVESRKRRSTKSTFVTKGTGTDILSQTKSSQNDHTEERSNRPRTASKAEKSKRVIESYELEEVESDEDSDSPVANEGEFRTSEGEEGDQSDECQKPHVSTFHSLRKYTMRLSTIREETFEEGPTSMIQDGNPLRELTRLKSKQKSRKLMSQVLLRQASEKLGVSASPSRRIGSKGGVTSESFDVENSGRSHKSELNLEGRMDAPGCCNWEMYERRRSVNPSESCSMF